MNQEQAEIRELKKKLAYCVEALEYAKSLLPSYETKRDYKKGWSKSALEKIDKALKEAGEDK